MREKTHLKYYLLPLLLTVLVLTIPTSEAANISGYFQPSGMYGGVPGVYSWENYCPLCGAYGTLAINPKGVPEGEITCLFCGADYDGCTGFDKWESGARGKLRSTTGSSTSSSPGKLVSKSEMQALQASIKDKIKETNSLFF
jgi:hypothetical protein